MKFRKAYLKNCHFQAFKDNPLKWENLNFSSYENDSINCKFDTSLKYEYHFFDDAPFYYNEKLNIDTSKYILTGVKFSQVLYENNKFAIFLMILEFEDHRACYSFLFEKTDREKEWEFKESLVELD